jgi:formate hydrogenlyase subunit 6/NADH:ubiquinone oxidoreductase subunit I
MIFNPVGGRSSIPMLQFASREGRAWTYGQKRLGVDERIVADYLRERITDADMHTFITKTIDDCVTCAACVRLTSRSEKI